MEFSISDVASFLDGKIKGNEKLKLSGFSSLTEAKEGDISFLANKNYIKFISQTKASCILVAEEIDSEINQIIVGNPDYSFAKVVEKFGVQQKAVERGVHKTAFVGENVVLGEDICISKLAFIDDDVTIGNETIIHPQAHVGNNVSIGKKCIIYPNVTIRDGSIIGDNVIVHSGTVIGSDGFGFSFVNGEHKKIPQIGIVEIKDDVEIGANVTIDRARFGKTVIGKGTKIDNLVQIAHNVETGNHCLIIAQSGIAGSTKLGNYVTLAAQAGLIGHINVEDKVTIGAQSGVTKSIKEGCVFMGSPAKDMSVYKRQEVAVRRLLGTQEKVKELEKEIASLKQDLKK